MGTPTTKTKVTFHFKKPNLVYLERQGRKGRWVSNAKLFRILVSNDLRIETGPEHRPEPTTTPCCLSRDILPKLLTPRRRRCLPHSVGVLGHSPTNPDLSWNTQNHRQDPPILAANPPASKLDWDPHQRLLPVPEFERLPTVLLPYHPHQRLAVVAWYPA